MRFHSKVGRPLAGAALATSAVLALAGCSAGSLGSSSGEQQQRRRQQRDDHLLVHNDDTEVASAKALVEAFQAANPTITVKLDTRPAAPRATTW